MKASEFLRKYEKQQDEKEQEDHSLEHNARDRAAHPERGLNAGTPHDWEDMERYKEELERMEREGAVRAQRHHHKD